MGSRNFVTDCGAATDGTSLCTTGINNWLTYARANPGSDLYIPDAAHGGADSYNLTSLFIDSGCINCRIHGDASKPRLVDCQSGLAYAILSHFSTNARISTAKAGETSLTLINESDASKVVDGQWIFIGGLTMQGSSYPPNFQWFEYVQVDTVTGSTITLKTPLYHGYLSTWPENINTNDSVNDIGGPAVIFPITGLDNNSVDHGISAWDTTSTVESVTIHSENQITMAFPLRTRIFNDCVFSRGAAAGDRRYAPSQTQTIIFNNCECGGNDTNKHQFEFDKWVSTMIFDNCTNVGVIGQGQNDITIFRNGTSIAQIVGTSRRTVIKNCTWNPNEYIHFGPGGFGQGDNVYIENTTMTYPADFQWLSRSSLGNTMFGQLGTLSNGVFTVPRNVAPDPRPGQVQDAAIQFTVPGNKFITGKIQGGYPLWIDDSSQVHSFTITDVTGDANNVYIYTDLPGSTIPNGLYGGNPGDGFLVYGCRSLVQVNSGPLDIAAQFRNDLGPILAPNRLVPRVSFISPASGTAGTNVTISGDFFSAVTDVTFGATAATSFTIIDDSTIVATAPSGTGSVHIFLTDPNGTSEAAPVTYDNGTSNISTSDLFSYVNKYILLMV